MSLALSVLNLLQGKPKARRLWLVLEEDWTKQVGWDVFGRFLVSFHVVVKGGRFPEHLSTLNHHALDPFLLNILVLERLVGLKLPG